MANVIYSKRSMVYGLIVSVLLFSAQPLYSQADTSSVEWIKVYFNMPAYDDAALPNNRSNSDYDLMQTLINRIDSASTSVDLCIYDLEHRRIGEALVRAADRGVRVRLVTDNYNRNDSRKLDEAMWEMLRKAGIISIDDDGDIYWPDGRIEDNDLTNAGADMHNKFAVIDAESLSPDDDYVWTGSTNLTFTGAYNTNHTVVIKDNEIAGVYTEEFEQMWGSDNAKPNDRTARFHKDKRDVSDHRFYVGDTKVELYFAPINRNDTKPSISNRIVEVIKKEAQSDVNFQAFAITPNIPLSRTIWDMSARGVIDLNGIIDRSFYYRYKNSGAIWASPGAKLANRMILPSNEMRKLHHKILILDAYHPDSSDKGVVITGSYNFSNNAEYNNDENLLIIYSDKIANQFYQDFKGVANRAQGKMEVPAPEIDPNSWYPVFELEYKQGLKLKEDFTFDFDTDEKPEDEKIEIENGREFKIEIAPGFGYGVRFLGVDVPSIYAGGDSADYFADHALAFVDRLLDDKVVRIMGPGGDIPRAKYGAFHAYVQLKDDDDPDGTIINANRYLLLHGIGRFSNYYAQHPDSVQQFREYEQQAREQNRGIWAHPEKIGTRIPRSSITSESGSGSTVSFPLNINTATADELQALPGIGPAYSKRIVEYRESNGPFTNLDQLTQVKGIGPKTLEKLRPNITLD